MSGEDDAKISAAESGFALAGLITCLIFFVGYLVYQWQLSHTDNDQVRGDFKGATTTSLCSDHASFG